MREAGSLPYIILKISSKWIEHLYIRSKTRKLLEENTEEMFHDVGFGNDFLDLTPKS